MNINILKLNKIKMCKHLLWERTVTPLSRYLLYSHRTFLEGENLVPLVSASKEGTVHLVFFCVLCHRKFR